MASPGPGMGPTSKPSPFAQTAPPPTGGEHEAGHNVSPVPGTPAAAPSPAPAPAAQPAPAPAPAPAPQPPAPQPAGPSGAPPGPTGAPAAGPTGAPPAAPSSPPPEPAPAAAASASGASEPDAVPDDAPKTLVGFLISYHSNELGDFWPIRQGKTFVGRKDAAPGLDMEIDHPTTSSRHAVIYASGRPGRVKVEDLGSTNGTFLKQEKLSANEKHELKDGDEIRFGGFVLTVKIID